MTETPMPAWWPELTAVPQDMADRVAAWLPTSTLDAYVEFLDAMYHYTLGSEARLRDAAALTGDPALRAFYLELAEEEAPHFELAEADLAAFGRVPGPARPEAVARFQAFWSGVTEADAAQHLGALYALESVASHLAQRAVRALGRLQLGADKARFVLVHLEADEVHGSLCEAHCRRVGGDDPSGLLAGARTAGECWVAMHECLRVG